MEEKNKTILKTLGVGAVATLGLFTMAGCSVKLTDEQIEKVMYTVDNSDQFMKDTLNLLEKQNAQLDLDEAWNLYKLASTKFLLNEDGIRNNLKVVMTCFDEYSEVVDYSQVHNFYSHAGQDVFSVEFEGLGYNIVYNDFDGDDELIYYYYNYDGDIHKGLQGNGIIEQYATVNINFSTLYGVTKEQIVSCEILENGNYKLTFVNERLEEQENEETIKYLSIFNLEISKDAKFISEKVSTGLFNEEGTMISSGVMEDAATAVIEYQYGEVDVEDILEKLEIAKSAEITQ